MNRTPLFILARTPGASQTVEWTAICRRKTPYLVINYEPFRETSRWVTVPRKRAFTLYQSGLVSPLSRHATLDRAIRAAQEARTTYADVEPGFKPLAKRALLKLVRGEVPDAG